MHGMPVGRDALMAPNLRRSVLPNEVEPGLRDPKFFALSVHACKA